MEARKTEDDDNEGHVEEEAECHQEKLNIRDTVVHVVPADALDVSEEHEQQKQVLKLEIFSKSLELTCVNQEDHKVLVIRITHAVVQSVAVMVHF